MESFKQSEKKEEAEAGPKKKFVHLLDTEEIEVKRLDADDIED